MYTIIKSVKYIVDSIYKLYRMTFWFLTFLKVFFQVLIYILIITWFILLYQSWIFQELYQLLKSLPI